MKTLPCFLAGLLALVFMLPSRGQLAGSVDPAFTTAVASVSGGTVNAVMVEPDGQILIAGSFNFVGGVARKNIARLESTGVLDPTFDPGTGPNAEVFCIALQSNGKVLIGGNFTSVNGQACGRIARLSDTGVVEGIADFNPGSGANGDVRSIAVQPSDGNIVVGGGFTTLNALPRSRIARLEPNGNVESTATFNPGTGTGGFFGGASRVWAVAIQPLDGKILIGGNFFTVNGLTRNSLARLETNGTVDALNPVVGGEVKSIAVQGNGHILIGGNFNGLFVSMILEARNGIARLNPDGTLEGTGTFDPGTGAADGGDVGEVKSIAVQADGKIVLGGRFTSFDGQACGSIARLDDDGTVETPVDFNPGVGAGGSFSTPGINSVAVQSLDGKVLAGGDFRSMAGQLRRAIARLHPSGVYDHGFAPGTLANSINEGFINASAVQPDGKVLIGGNFNLVGGQARSSIARLNADGSIEDTETFDAGTGTAADSPVFAIAVQADGKIVIGGQFDGVDGLPRYRLARLHPDGAVEDVATFHPDIGAPGQVNCIAIQPGGEILIGGDFTEVGGESHNGIARLLPNGDLDPSFNLGTGATGTFGGRVYSIAVQPDGYIVVGGDFTAMNGAPHNGIARLKGDGTLDPAFTATGVGSGSSVSCVAVDPQGQILVGGDFTTVNGVASGGIARLNALDGSRDGTFNPGTGANSTVTGVGIQADARMVCTGPFTSINGLPCPKIARLSADGTVEQPPAFSPGTGADGFPGGVTLQADGKILITGEITTFNGDPHVGIARLHNDPATATLSSPGSSSLLWARGGSSPEVGHVAFELSTNGGTTWTPLGAGTRIAGGWEKTGLSLPGSGLVRARGRTSGGAGNGSSGLVGQQISLGGALTPYQQWKQLHLGNSAAPDLDDPDFDGIVTLAEYGLNTLPHVPGGSVVTAALFTYGEGERLRIFVPRNPDHNDVTVEVRAADDLAGPWTTIATSTLGAPFSGPGYVGGDSAAPGLKTVEIRDVVNVADEPRRFLHVRVTP